MKLSFMVSQTIIHELAHAVSVEANKFKVLDLPDKATSYDWVNVVQKDTDVAIHNADTYAYLGNWAILADLGYTLPRVNEQGLSSKEREDREDDIRKGWINGFTDITKRALMAIVGVPFSA